MYPAVARRCIPTIVDVVELVNNTLNLESDQDLDNRTLGDLVTTVNIDAIVNGSL